MAFLGDFGKFLGLGSSEEVLGDAGAATAAYFGLPPEVGRKVGSRVGDATSSLSGGGTADQPEQQSALPTPRPEDLLTRQETQFSGTNQAGFAPFFSLAQLPQLTRGVKNLFGTPTKMSPTGVGTAIGTGAGLGLDMLFGNGNQMRMRPALTQSRRSKAQVRRLASMVGIPAAAQIMSQKLQRNVTANDVIDLLLRTFRNDGAFITKAQVRNLRRTTNRFKSLEKQVKEATSMTKTTRRAPARRSNSTTLIKN